MPNLRRIPRTVRRRPRSAQRQDVARTEPQIAELEFGALRWLNIETPTAIETAYLAEHFDFHELDLQTRLWVPVTDPDQLRAICRSISPIYHVSPDDPPTLILHGDADQLVPIQQAETFIDKLKEAGVPAELVVKKGGGHGWPDLGKDMSTIADWFDKYLGKKGDKEK